jgi:hypothetical protein
MDDKICLSSPQIAGRHGDPHGVLSCGYKVSLLAAKVAGECC